MSLTKLFFSGGLCTFHQYYKSCLWYKSAHIVVHTWKKSIFRIYPQWSDSICWPFAKGYSASEVESTSVTPNTGKDDHWFQLNFIIQTHSWTLSKIVIEDIIEISLIVELVIRPKYLSSSCTIFKMESFKISLWN